MAGRYEYEITVEGLLPEHWAQWFGGLSVRAGETQTVLTGVLDQTALLGLLTTLHGLNLELVSLGRRRMCRRDDTPGTETTNDRTERSMT